ncbi:Homebox domain-containing protein [Phytophthora cinnamomi]|uniref:Homebox domain-containing protein n=1 Tax=Phytophthora cinnamomi TaxID=4785 RepID=UPI00355A06D5|nr:Homebox domain-containing protein [Phytophthora cinnamomi]
MTDGSAASTGRSTNLWIRGILALLLATGLLALALEASTLDFRPNLRRVAHASNTQQLLQHRRPRAGSGSGYGQPQDATVSLEELLQLQNAARANASDEVQPDDLLHLSLLHGACIAHKDAIVTWEFGAPGPHQVDEEHNLATLIHEDDPDLLQMLKQCPDVDLFLPSGVRNNGYCEDTMAYTKYLSTRLLPLWALTKEMYDPELGRTVDYFDLCPNTAMLFFQHYWEDIPSSPRWPKNKKMYLMPNIEMWELDENHFWRVDVVLCKTRICEERVKLWYEQKGNPRDTKVVYTKHTSSDQASYARRVLGDEVKPQNFSDVRFIHTVGGSYWKGTRQVIECWLSRPNFPPLDLYIHKWAYDGMFKGSYEKRIPKSQIRLTTDEVDATTFTKAVAESSYFLCPSQMEGYGHYMNQARAAGGVIITTDMDPMKELVPSDDMGLRVKSRTGHDRNIFLGGKSRKRNGLRDVPGMVAYFSSRDLCKTVEHLLNDISIDERKEMGENARRQYHKDTKFFEQAMLELRVRARRDANAISPGDAGDDEMEVISSESQKHLLDRPTTG